MPAAPERPRRPRGRPSSYRPELGEVICGELAAGIPLAQVCGWQGMPSRRTVLAWAHRHPDFARRYERARDLGAEAVADRLCDAYRRAGAGLRKGQVDGAATAEVAELDRLHRAWVTRRRIPTFTVVGCIVVNGGDGA